MSVDRVLSKSLRAGRRLSKALLGKEPAPKSAADTPMGTLRSLFDQPSQTGGGEPELYKSTSGPYSVDRHHAITRDPVGGREVPLTVHYPLAVPENGGFPVVVISPGLGAHPQATRYLECHLASHGYIVLCPSHLGSDWTACFRRSPLGAFSQRELATRVSELCLALNLLETGRLPSPLRQRADLDRVALVGHSFGALTMQAVAGVPVIDSDGCELQLCDPRFRAFIGMSPYGDAFPARRLGMTQQGYAKIERPILFISGDRDDLWTLGRGHHTHLDPYRWVNTSERYHLLIGDTRHADFSELFGRIKKRTAIMVNSTATAFLDSYLKDQAIARDYLKSDLQLLAARHQSWAFVGEKSAREKGSPSENQQDNSGENPASPP